jgi:hypothetical protein
MEGFELSRMRLSRILPRPLQASRLRDVRLMRMLHLGETPLCLRQPLFCLGNPPVRRLRHLVMTLQ